MTKSKYATPWDSISPAEQQARVDNYNNRALKILKIAFTSMFAIGSLIVWMNGKMSFMEFVLTCSITIPLMGFGFPILLMSSFKKCPNCNVLADEFVKKIHTEIIHESEHWVQGIRQDAIRDASGKITGYIDRPEKQKRTQQTVDHVYHCQMCESTWRIRQEYES